ncbi:hypothetical protein YC2023_096480 [Brassica napus]
MSNGRVGRVWVCPNGLHKMGHSHEEFPLFVSRESRDFGLSSCGSSHDQLLTKSEDSKEESKQSKKNRSNPRRNEAIREETKQSEKKSHKNHRNRRRTKTVQKKVFSP